MSERLKLQIAVLVKNSFIVACFTALAMYFGHFWIVLFSALFMSEVKKDG